MRRDEFAAFGLEIPERLERINDGCRMVAVALGSRDIASTSERRLAFKGSSSRCIKNLKDTRKGLSFFLEGE